VTRCECGKRRIAEQRIRAVLDDWPEYASASFENPRDLVQREAIRRIAANPSGSYYISGYYASGKTWLLVAQYRHLALSGARCLLRSSKQLMDELRKAELTPPQGQQPFESPVLQMVNLAASGHLFWDDVEKAAGRSEFRAEAIFDLLDTIKRRQLGVTVTSNLQLSDLTRILGDAAVARLDRMCTKITL
jgi:DNA replication protein DnaC